MEINCGCDPPVSPADAHGKSLSSEEANYDWAAGSTQTATWLHHCAGRGDTSAAAQRERQFLMPRLPLPAGAVTPAPGQPISLAEQGVTLCRAPWPAHGR